MKKIEKMLEIAKESIAIFCKEECNAYCCRKGFLELTKKEAELLTNKCIKEKVKIGSIKPQKDEKFSLNLNIEGCPSLDKNSRCIIHNNEDRPNVCKDYPIFIDGKNARFSKRCPAVKKEMFYKVQHELICRGYKII